MPWLRIIIQVASVLLCCAFVYDIFWVFVSPLIFHESVMIAVSFNINFASPFFPPSREKKRNHANSCFFFLPANKITLIILLSLLKHTSLIPFIPGMKREKKNGYVGLKLDLVPILLYYFICWLQHWGLEIGSRAYNGVYVGNPASRLFWVDDKCLICDASEKT